jgi:hypothetical protein
MLTRHYLYIQYRLISSNQKMRENVVAIFVEAESLINE